MMPLAPFTPNALIAQITSTLHEALALRGEAKESLYVDHEGLSLGGSVDRYLFTVVQGTIVIDFSRLGGSRIGIDRIALESHPDVADDPNHGTQLSATLELYSDSRFMGWTYQDNAETVITLERLMDMLHLLARTHHQMTDTARFIQHTALARHDMAISA